MGCACNKGRTTFQVVRDELDSKGNTVEKLLYQSTSKVAADAISGRPQNKGSIVREKK